MNDFSGRMRYYSHRKSQELSASLLNIILGETNNKDNLFSIILKKKFRNHIKGFGYMNIFHKIEEQFLS